MSVIRVDNFGPSAGGTTYSARGIAKAWCNWSSQSTFTIFDSENISSVTDDGLGLSITNYANAFDASTYCVVTGPDGTDASTVNYALGINSRATSSTRLILQNGNGGQEDRPYNASLVTGDLA